MGGVALGDDQALLEGLSGAEFEVHGVGAIPDGADARGAVEGVVEKDGGLVADGRLGYDVARAGDVPGLELLETHEGCQGPPVSKTDGLEELQVDGVVDVAVWIEVLVADLEPRNRGWVLQGFSPLSVAPGIVHTLPLPHLI